MFKKVFGIIALLINNPGALAQQRENTVLAKVHFGPDNLPETPRLSSYVHVATHLAKRASLLDTPTSVFNETTSGNTLFGVSSCQNSANNRFIVAYYAINSGSDVSRYECAVFDSDWNHLTTFFDPGIDNTFNPSSNFNQINLRTIAGQGDGLFVLNLHETESGKSREIYCLGFSPTHAQVKQKSTHSIESVSRYTINSFEASCSPDENSVMIVTGETDTVDDSRFIKFNAFTVTSEVSFTTDFNLPGRKIINDAINPDVTHHADQSSLTVFERPSNQTVYYVRLDKTPSFTELQAETVLFQNRSNPKILRADDSGNMIVATIGTATNDNRVYLSKVDINGTVTHDVAVTDHQASGTWGLGKMRLQDEKVLLPVSSEVLNTWAYRMGVYDQESLGSVSGKNEFEIAAGLSLDAGAIDIIPVTQNQTDIVYLEENFIAQASVNTFNHPPTVTGSIATVNVDVNSSFNILINNPFSDSDNDELTYTLALPGGGDLPGDLALDVNDDQLRISSSGLAQDAQHTLRLTAADNAGNQVQVDFTLNVQIVQTNSQSSTSTTTATTTRAQEETTSPQVSNTNDNNTTPIPSGPGSDIVINNKPMQTPSKSEGLSNGAIIGIVVSILCCFGLTAALSAVGLFLYQRRQNNNRDGVELPNVAGEGIEPRYQYGNSQAQHYDRVSDVIAPAKSGKQPANQYMSMVGAQQANTYIDPQAPLDDGSGKQAIVYEAWAEGNNGLKV